MRVVKDNKDDPHYDDRPRRVWLRDLEVHEPWVVADEFRRVVILEDGTVLNGNVFVEKLNSHGENISGTPNEPAINAGFVGASVFAYEAAAPAAAPAAPAAAPAAPAAPVAQEAAAVVEAAPAVEVQAAESVAAVTHTPEAG